MSSNTEYTCDYRFGDIHDIREFITINSLLCKKLADDLTDLDSLLKYNYENFRYPLNVFGEPAPEGEFRYAREWIFFYSFTRAQPYIWQFPYEVMITEKGICIDTANFVTTMLRLMFLNSEKLAYTVLGAVYNEKGNLLGYHAWAEYGKYWLETTTHEGQGNPADIYINKISDTEGRLNGLIYKAYLKFNDKEVVELEKPHELFLKFFGPSSEKKEDIKRWKVQELRKQYAIWKRK